MKGTPRSKKASDFGRQLSEKQQLKKIYGLRENQFRRYVEMAQGMAGNPAENLLCLLEIRLDNVLFRAGFALTRPQARQYTTHGLFKINDRRVDVPSTLVKPGDVITPRKATQFGETRFNKSSWFETDPEAKSISIKFFPKRDQIDTPINENLVMQFYSR